jgi:hypothetical protein
LIPPRPARAPIVVGTDWLLRVTLETVELL